MRRSRTPVPARGASGPPVPVAFAGPGEAPRVTVNVTNNAPGAQARVSESGSGDDRVFDVIIDQIEGAIASNIGRGVGPLAGTLAASYGLGRQPR